MLDGGVGRLLVASLHQGIADLLPDRLEFYEAWLNPAGLRNGRIGLAPLVAVLSFLRLEGDAYRTVSARAGQYTADWTVAELAPMHRALIGRLPPVLRRRLVMRIARRMVRRTYDGSRAIVRWQAGAIDLRGSIFCGVREPSDTPLCGFYASAFEHLLRWFALDAEVEVTECRATGATRCRLSMTARPSGVR